ncbi:MAG: PEP-CTERM sorting domain-containing protein [Acidobacteriaceae bacterium]|nr:PEP-CTERM sorting domain-containing protein [Acidobacteriaceae bacterium]
MTVTKSLLACILLVAAASFPASASSLASASASAGANSCSQSDPNSASCNVSLIVGSQTARASAFANAGWTLSESGTLETTTSGFGSNTSANASVNFTNSLIVTGVTGSGEIQLVFSGFQMNVVNSVNGAFVSPVGIQVGSFATAAILPNGSPQTFSTTAPITFGSPTVFAVAFEAFAEGTFFHDGTFAINNADGVLQFPTFVVTDASGNVLRNASVQFVPEPSTWFFLVLGLAALLVIRKMKVCRTAADDFLRRPF